MIKIEKKYKNMQEVFSLLNQSGEPYLVLRNYENILSEEMYIDGHGDVDMLVSDSSRIVQILNAKFFPIHGDDGTHYYIEVNNEIVKLDLRHIGDGYYCQKWEMDMLERRRRYENFYVMTEKDYFYSLIYHATLQKRIFSQEYRHRLGNMAQSLGISISENSNIHQFILVLEKFMRESQYTYTFAVDKHVPLMTKYISKKMLEKNKKLFWIHWKYELRLKLIEFAVKCKHFFCNGKFE